jgi:hypothetical protein
MPGLSCLRRWFGLPSRLLLLGIGAVSAAGGQAAAAPAIGDAPPVRVPQQSVADFAVVHVWTDGAGRIYLSEAGGEARELRFGDTAEARILRELLERGAATAARPQALPHRIILVGGGGDGVPPPRQSPTSQTPPSTGGGADAKAPGAAQSNRQPKSPPPRAPQKG